jgi:hypothetical protein
VAEIQAVVERMGAQIVTQQAIEREVIVKPTATGNWRLTTKQLQKKLRHLGLKTTGNKKALVE